MQLFSPASVYTRSAPAQEPVTLDQIKAMLKIDGTDEDMVLNALIRAGREAVERYTERSLITRDLSLFLDAWPESKICSLPQGPVQSVESVLTCDAEGAFTALDAGYYYADLKSDPARVVIETAENPSREAGGIEIRYRSGYGDTSESVPASLTSAIMLFVAHLFENRGEDSEQVLTKSGAKTLCSPYRFMGVK